MSNRDALIDELLVRVRRLEDEREIVQVLTRYGFAADVGDADATAALYTDDTVIDLGLPAPLTGSDGARQLVLDDRHQAIVGRCAHTMGPFVVDVDVDGDHATAVGYVRVYVSDPDMRNPRLWRLGCTRFELRREGSTWRIATRVARSVGAADGAELLRGGL